MCQTPQTLTSGQPTSRRANWQPYRRAVAIFAFAGLALLVSGIPTKVVAQAVLMSVRVSPNSAARVVVEGTCKPQTQWSFVDSIGGVIGLGGRVENFQLFAQDGDAISVRKLAPGQFSSASAATRFKYEVNLAPPLIASDSARVSWLNANSGLLMLRDLLPIFTDQEKRAISLRTRLPSGWSGYIGGNPVDDNPLAINDADDAVVTVGTRLRASEKALAGGRLHLVTAGDWAFTDAEALDLAAKIFAFYRDLFGGSPVRDPAVILFSYPQQVRADLWTAETRGATVTLLTGKLPSKIGALAQLSTPLTHELFHLWVPNGLALTGSYDWFYEGFTVYQAARTAVRLELLTFTQFLDALARAYDGYLNTIDRDRLSLIEASERRWTTGQSAVYSKAMVVAFLYDLKVRSENRGKRSLDDLYRKTFQSYGLVKGDERQLEGNAALMNAFGEEGMQTFVGKFISAPAAINLSAELSPYGLTGETVGSKTRLVVSEHLSKQQRDLLRQLGYNDAARSTRR